jgi:hypothetical protein
VSGLLAGSVAAAPGAQAADYVAPKDGNVVVGNLLVIASTEGLDAVR